MNKISKTLANKVNNLVDAVDEVNNRPAIRKYRSNKTSGNVAYDLSTLEALEEDIADVEESLCSKYQLRANLIRLRDCGSLDAVIPTTAVSFISGPRDTYDTTTMFAYQTNTIPNCPLANFFKSIYSIRPDDIVQSASDSRKVKRKRHEVMSANSLSNSKALA